MKETIKNNFRQIITYANLMQPPNTTMIKDPNTGYMHTFNTQTQVLVSWQIC